MLVIMNCKVKPGRVLQLSVLVLLLSFFETHAQTPIDLSRPVKAMAGSVSASGGGASYTVPISIPNGTKGVAPQVSVTYSSQGGEGNGFAGYGWTLSPISQIS